MTEGVDYSYSHPSPSGLYAAGKRFAMRYIGLVTTAKYLTAAERDALFGAGLAIVLLFETTASSALNGYSRGVAHGSSAGRAAHILGAPSDIPIYFAVDFDATEEQWPACADYLRGCASQIGVGRVGVYGGIRTMRWAARDKVATWFHQTYAWSGGQWFTGNHVEQYHNGVTVAGGVVDLDRSRQPNYGQWSKELPMSQPLVLTKNDQLALIYRELAVIRNTDVEGGPTLGEVNQLAAAVKAIAADVAAVKAALEAAPPPGGLSVEQVYAAVVRALNATGLTVRADA